MKRGFYTIMAAQFFSSLADNALFVAAVELLKNNDSPSWAPAALVPMFALFYVVFAPFVGALADAQPKGRIMFISNGIKVFGCVLMLTGFYPLLAYAIVGLGAAAYSPAKYGILTELLPSSQLVKANGWIEGLTIASIIFGVMLGGQLVSPLAEQLIQKMHIFGIASVAQGAVACIIIVYLIAAMLNLKIPRTDAPLRPFTWNAWSLISDFFRCNNLLWRDHLGKVSLASTTLFWGVSGNLRYIILAWGAIAMGYSVTESSNLIGVVAIGTAIGAVVASMYVRLDKAPSVMLLGVAMGLMVLVLNTTHSLWFALPFLFVLGGLGGFMVVPMNALLQHRGHNLMGSGRSIAVQNFNEQASVVILGLIYSLATGFGLSAFGAIIGFGILVALVMFGIRYWYLSNCKKYPVEIEQLLAIARKDSE
jgi:MFS transporter, LPLT family, lysophospholipid transporter